MALLSAPALEPASAPMRRRSSSIWRLVRVAVPVRITLEVRSGRPGALCAVDALPLRMKSWAVIFGKVCDSARTTSRPFARVTEVRFGQATGRSGPRAGAAVLCELTAGIVLEDVGVIGRLHSIFRFLLWWGCVRQWRDYSVRNIFARLLALAQA